MALAKNINSYNDIRRVFDTALVHGGATLELETPNKAIFWRRRAYTFRKLFVEREIRRQGAVVGYSPVTPYDDIVLGVNKNVVEIRIRQIEGVLRSLGGKPLDVVAPLPLTPDSPMNDDTILPLDDDAEFEAQIEAATKMLKQGGTNE